MTAALKNISRLMSPTGECLLVFCAALQPAELCKVAARMDPWAKYSETLLKVIPKTQDLEKRDMMRFVSRLMKEAELFPTIMEALTSTMFDGWSEDDIFAAYKGISPIAHLVTEPGETCVGFLHQRSSPKTARSRSWQRPLPNVRSESIQSSF
ncbi:hypothetical protein MTO96_007643 [Rhipicephalus appendiculatus]